MARDRIISGLARAVIVVEASSKSGSLDTAERGRKQGRLTYAVPGSPGTDGLLKTEARALDPDLRSIDLDELAEAIIKHEVGVRRKTPPSQPSLF